MARFEQRDVAFDVPRHWVDKTLYAFSAPAKKGQQAAASLVMTRDELEPGETLRAYGERQIAELAKRVDGFELVATEPTKLGGMNAVSIRFLAKAASGPLDQRLLLVESQRRTLYCFTTTSPKADADQNNPLFERILSTVRFPTIEEGAEDRA